MLQVGDKVVYPMHGAGIIAGVQSCEINGEIKEYFIFKMPVGNVKLMIPQNGLDKVGLREVISQDMVETVVEVLRQPPEYITGSWNKRFHAYLEQMKTGSLVDVAAVARNLILQDQKKKISSGERKILDLAQQILISELVYACDKTPDEIEAWLMEILSISTDAKDSKETKSSKRSRL